MFFNHFGSLSSRKVCRFMTVLEAFVCLNTTAGQFLTCCAFLLLYVCRVHSCAFCLLPAETSGWSQLLVQCATCCKLTGKVHVHAPVCVFTCPVHASCFRATAPKVLRKELCLAPAVIGWCNVDQRHSCATLGQRM